MPWSHAFYQNPSHSESNLRIRATRFGDELRYGLRSKAEKPLLRTGRYYQVGICKRINVAGNSPSTSAEMICTLRLRSEFIEA